MSEPASDCFAVRSFGSEDVIDDTSPNRCGGYAVESGGCIWTRRGLLLVTRADLSRRARHGDAADYPLTKNLLPTAVYLPYFPINMLVY